MDTGDARLSGRRLRQQTAWGSRFSFVHFATSASFRATPENGANPCLRRSHNRCLKLRLGSGFGGIRTRADPGTDPRWIGLCTSPSKSRDRSIEKPPPDGDEVSVGTRQRECSDQAYPLGPRMRVIPGRGWRGGLPPSTPRDRNPSPTGARIQRPAKTDSAPLGIPTSACKKA